MNSLKRRKTVENWPVNRCKRVIRPLLAKIHYLTQLYSKSPGVFEVHIDHNSNHLAIFLKPASAQERLTLVKPFISTELYQAFQEIFNIFKNIITNIEADRIKSNKLGKQCCTVIGKAMLLSSRTSYFRLNQNILFDDDTLPKDIKEYNKNLSNDIDDWLMLEPTSIFEGYRLDFLMGYIIHLIVFNLQHILYMLVPTLVHWLVEELIQTNNYCLRSIANDLFMEFWKFDQTKYYDNINYLVIVQLTGVDANSNIIFWTLFDIGFWDKFISSLSFETGQSGFQYEILLLDVLPLNDKLNYYSDYRMIYGILNDNFNHLQVNNILLCILTNLVTTYKGSKERYELEKVYDYLIEFVSAWLSFGFELPGLFNSLSHGNQYLFNGVLKLLNILTTRLNLPKDLYYLLILLSRYYQNQSASPSLIKLDNYYKTITKCMLEIQKNNILDYVPLKYSSIEINNLIRWLLENHFHKLPKAIFHVVYGKFSKYYDDELRHLSIKVQKFS